VLRRRAGGVPAGDGEHVNALRGARPLEQEVVDLRGREKGQRDGGGQGCVGGDEFSTSRRFRELRAAS
jgi:hypothetical protein